MSLDTPSKFTTEPDSSPAYPWGWIITLGITMILMPCIQAYLMVRPWMELATFLPAEIIWDQVVSTLFVSAPSALAAVLMLIGGALLIFGQVKAGWILGVSTFAFTLFYAIETLLIAWLPTISNPKTMGFLIEVGIELLQMTYYMPILILGIQIAGTVFFLRRSIRSRLGIQRKQFSIAAGVFAMLLIGLHISLLLFYLQNQS